MFYRFSCLYFYIIFQLFIFSGTIHAQTFGSFVEFKEFIQNIMVQSIANQEGEEIDINLVQLDEHMKLPFCNGAINTSIAQPGLSIASNSVILKCNDTVPWVIYVPVQVKIMADMITATRRIMPGEAITDADILIKKIDKNQVYGDYFDDSSQIADLVASRLILPGSILSRKNLKKALMIQRNQTINLILKHGLIEITMTGIAKTDGYMNEKIKVANVSSKKIVDAMVVGPNSAQIEY